jgi:hypothetical protein
MQLRKSLTELLGLRFEFEELTSNYNMPQGSDINTLEWFVENGHRSNSLRNGFNDAKEIANIILTEYNNDRANKGSDSSSTENY